MKLRLTSFLLALSAIFLSTIGADAASKSWRPESVAEREIDLAKEFSEKGLKLGSPVFLRVYKQTSEMELWVQQGPRYELFKIYKICRWSGGLGPKFYEGDRQSPEGLYRITTSDLIVNQRWDRAMNINYPNNFDQVNGRGGSSILIHGGCGSIGCFAIQNQNVEEVYGAVRAALRNSQAYVPVLTLPFRYSALAPEKEDTLHMSEFWSDLRRADCFSNGTSFRPPPGFATAATISRTGAATGAAMPCTCLAASRSTTGQACAMRRTVPSRK